MASNNGSALVSIATPSFTLASYSCCCCCADPGFGSGVGLSWGPLVGADVRQQRQSVDRRLAANVPTPEKNGQDSGRIRRGLPSDCNDLFDAFRCRLAAGRSRVVCGTPSKSNHADVHVLLAGDCDDSRIRRYCPKIRTRAITNRP